MKVDILDFTERLCDIVFNMEGRTRGKEGTMYSGIIFYKDANGIEHKVIAMYRFDNSRDALTWMAEKFASFMRNWPLYDPNGLYVMGRIFCHDDSFDEMHEMRCGM